MCVCRSGSEDVLCGNCWLDALRVSDRYDGQTNTSFCCIRVIFDHLDFNKRLQFNLKVTTVSVRHITLIPLVLLPLENGDLFLWGSNKHGQLISSEPFLPSPTPVKTSLLDTEKVARVWSGWTHVVAQTGEAA